jgi:hypothetical protein
VLLSPQVRLLALHLGLLPGPGDGWALAHLDIRSRNAQPLMDWTFFGQLMAAILFWTLVWKGIGKVIDRYEDRQHRRFKQKVDRYRRGHR